MQTTALSIDCDHCNAEVGKPCRTRGGKVLDFLHFDRMYFARTGKVASLTARRTVLMFRNEEVRLAESIQFFENLPKEAELSSFAASKLSDKRLQLAALRRMLGTHLAT